MMLLYPPFKMFGQVRPEQVGLNIGLALVCLVMAIYLYAALAAQAYLGATGLLWIGVIGGALLGYLASGLPYLWDLLAQWGLIIAPALLAGRLVGMGVARPVALYTAVALLLVFGMAAFSGMWRELTDAAPLLKEQLSAGIAGSLRATGYAEETVRTAMATMSRWVGLTIRLAPATTLLGLLLPFAIGYLLVAGKIAQWRGEFDRSLVFTEWKMPFWVIALVSIGALVRLGLGEPWLAVADNLLAFLGVLYLVTGLALLEGLLRRFRVGIGWRVIMYVAIFFSGLVGAAALALAGLADSFVDWRGRAAKIDFDK